MPSVNRGSTRPKSGCQLLLYTKNHHDKCHVPTRFTLPKGFTVSFETQCNAAWLISPGNRQIYINVHGNHRSQLKQHITTLSAATIQNHVTAWGSTGYTISGPISPLQLHLWEVDQKLHSNNTIGGWLCGNMRYAFLYVSILNHSCRYPALTKQPDPTSWSTQLGPVVILFTGTGITGIRIVSAA